MSSRETVVRVKLLSDGRLEVEDWRGTISVCSPCDLGSRVRAVLDDPNLPPVEVTNPGAIQVAEFYARALLPPELRPLAGPGIQALQDLLARVQRSIQRPGAASAPSSRPEPQDVPRHPPGSARRRGRRVA